MGSASVMGSIDQVRDGQRVVALLPPGTLNAKRPCLERREVMARFETPSGVFNFLLPNVAPGQYQLAVGRFTMTLGAVVEIEFSTREIVVAGEDLDLGRLALPPRVAPRVNRDRTSVEWTPPSGYSPSAYQLDLGTACRDGAARALAAAALSTPGMFKIVNENPTTGQIAIDTVALRD